LDTQTQTVDVYFMVDGETLEAQACLLAPTLKRNLREGQSAAAYVREDYAARIDPITREVLAAAGVETRLIPETATGHAPWSAPYPHGNKILAMAQPRRCDVSVFIDTDTVLSEPVDFARELGEAEIGACVSDYSNDANTEENWTRFYGLFGLTLPTDRVRLQAGRKLTSLPYFNAGVIVTREHRDGVPTEIGRQWLDMALAFDAQVQVAYNRNNIDQFTLPILGYKRGHPVKALDPRLNFNIQSHGRGEGRAQALAHYHRIGVLWKHPGHAQHTLECLADLCGPDMIDRLVERW
jgi:hypothetical protein